VGIEVSRIVELATDIVSAYVSHNSVQKGDLPELIRSVAAQLQAMQTPTLAPAVEVAPQTPAVAIKRSVGKDYIVCLEDGKKFKSLKRHLRTAYNMTPDQYRSKWSLPADYPMVAPNYAKARSQLAKSMGLGQSRRKRKIAAE
jgi:predicted transcriptional regulator